MTYHTFASHDGRRLAYRDEGEGPAVLCLAGLTRNTRDFETVAAHLQGAHRVIRLDSRGRGQSSWAVDPVAEYSIPVEAQDAITLIDHLGLGTVSILGTSRGGILGMSLAAMRPEQISCLILNDVGAVIEAAGMLRIVDYIGRAPTAPDFEAAAEALMRANAREFPGVPHDRWVQMARALFDDNGGRPVLSYDPALRTAVMSSFNAEEPEVSLWPLFETTLETPLLCIRGENSDLLSSEVAAQMQERHFNMRLVEIKDRGHVPFLDEPDAVQAIDAFLKVYAK